MKKTEEALRESEERYRSVVENSHDGILIADDNYQLTYVNDELCDILGYSRDELIGEDFRKFLDEESKELVADRYRRRQEGEDLPPRYEFNVVRKDGEKRRVEISSTVIADSGGRTKTVAQILDITERKEAEKRLRQYKRAVESSEDLFAAIDNDYKYLFANEAYRRAFQSDKGRFRGRHVEEVLGNEVFENSIKPMVDRCLKGENVRYELSRRVSEGEERYFGMSYFPLIGKDGEIMGVAGVAKDITERKRAEEREEFLHSLLRHDLQNKLQIIRNALTLLENTDLSEDQKDFIDMAMGSSNKGKDLVEKVRTLRKLEKEEVAQTNMETAIRKAVGENEPVAEEKDIEINYDCEGCVVQGGSLLEELVSNLLENSIKHSGCDEVVISTKESDGGCVVRVEDDGCGVPDEEKGKIFERGYRWGDSAGSGLGMYLVKEIAEHYGGYIEVKDSELGGARFDVYLKSV